VLFVDYIMIILDYVPAKPSPLLFTVHNENLGGDLRRRLGVLNTWLLRHSLLLLATPSLPPPTFSASLPSFIHVSPTFPAPPFRLSPNSDYSCALQRDILIHGRLYVTQNWLCFYANIFSWETLVQL